MAKVLLTGFPDVETAQGFIDWYINSGEQDASYHFEEHQPDFDPTTVQMKVMNDG